jgi:ABC-2 type transport system permease protein
VDELTSLRKDLGIAWRIASLRLRGQMQYRSSFLMQIAGNFLINFAEVLVLWTLFSRFNNLGNWNLQEVMFLHGLSMVMFGLASTIANGVDTVPELIREGTFDRILLRPMSTFIQALVNEVSFRYLGLIFQGLLLLGISIVSLDVQWTVGKIIYLPIVILSGTVLFSALYTVVAIVSFWTINSIEVVNAFTYGGSDLGQYPIHIFDRWMRNVFLWFVPIGLVTYYPALHILAKDDPLGLPTWMPYMAPLASVLFAIVIGWGWGFGIRHYRSTGS